MRVFFRKLRNLSFFIQYYCLVSETPCAKLCATLKLFNVKFSHQSYSQVTKCLAKAVCRRSEQLQFAKKSSLFWQAFVRFGFIESIALMPSHPIILPESRNIRENLSLVR